MKTATTKPKNKRITNAQKSIRTNDIENVGKTARHHTFFEMLGNFSIGDYFKKEAIPFAWHFLTDPEWMGFDKDRLYVTVYIDDAEAYDIWTKVCGVSPSHILKTPNNFWEIGDRYIEVWNVVFSQYNSEEGVDRKDYKELPQKNIDTGMGLERLVCIVQGGETNFDTDLFLPVIREVEKMTSKKYEGANKMAYRVIADHIRSLSFAIGDGALPGNEGRGYVLRRLLRRAVMHGRRLGINETFLYKLVPTVGKIMESYYPEVLEKREFIEKIVRREEETFARTIDAGSNMLDQLLADLKAAGKDTVEGKDIFKLYDTYGFPVELTEELAEDKGFKIDHAGFEAAMKEQQERARASVVKGGSMGMQNETLSNITEESVFSYEEEVLDSTLSVIIADNDE